MKSVTVKDSANLDNLQTLERGRDVKSRWERGKSTILPTGGDCKHRQVSSLGSLRKWQPENPA